MNKLIIMFLFFTSTVLAQTPLTNTFTYQGELKFNNTLANGSYDFQFVVVEGEIGLFLELVTVTGVTVTNGVFTVPITLNNDLFTGNKIWLDIAVKVSGTGDPYEQLSPRQEVTSSPYAIHAQFVGADAVTGVQIANGSITASDVDTGSVQARISGTCTAGNYIQSVNADGTVNCVADNDTIAPPAWGLGGNAASAGDFIGTTNVEPFVVKVNGKQVLELQDKASISSGHAPNIIMGGDNNTISATFLGSTITGGSSNTISSNTNEYYGTISGGLGNTVSSKYSTIGGGNNNTVSGDYATISGGIDNVTSGLDSVVSGGYSNRASGSSSVVSGGLNNSATGISSTVPGGSENQAGGVYSFAAGFNAIVRDPSASGDPDGDFGTFVWSDSTATLSNQFISTGPNQFLIRATGGVGIGTNNPNGHQLNVLGSSYLRNGLDTSTSADLVLGGGSTNATDDGVLTSDPTVAGSDLFIKSNDAVLIFVDANDDGDVGNFKVRTALGTTLLEVLETGVVNIPGSLNVTGSVSKASGTFKIDHPLDPENKYLYHSFVESPDMMNVYNGNIITDKAGEAWVELPDWFEALNKDFRYQLTVLGVFAQAIVGEKMRNNRFLIKTSQPNIEVSWQVTGIRHDAYAEKNRIQVEVEKPESERGTYLYPKAWGITDKSK